MNKKETAEIRKNLTPEGNIIQKMRTCYVDAEKNIVFSEYARNFFALPEEDTFKYLEIAKKGLSGKIGKNLFCLETSRGEQEGVLDSISRLVSSGMDDEDAAKEVFASMIESFPCVDNFYIILFYCVYDVPTRAADGAELEGSDFVYSAILGCACPVTLSKAGLSYIPEKNQIADSGRNRFVDPPQEAFLYPAFTDRMPDTSQVMYYTKKPAEIDDTFVENVLGCASPVAPDIQKDAFAQALGEGLGRQCDFEAVQEIRKGVLLNGEGEEKLDSATVQELVQAAGGNDEAGERASTCMDKALGIGAELDAGNLSDPNRVKITTEGVEVTVKGDQMGRVSVIKDRGQKKLVIDLDLPYLFDGIETF